MHGALFWLLAESSPFCPTSAATDYPEGIVIHMCGFWTELDRTLQAGTSFLEGQPHTPPLHLMPLCWN
jgi:hypothetical protein